MHRCDRNPVTHRKYSGREEQVPKRTSRPAEKKNPVSLRFDSEPGYWKWKERLREASDWPSQAISVEKPPPAGGFSHLQCRFPHRFASRGACKICGLRVVLNLLVERL